MKQAYLNKSLRSDALSVVRAANEIIESYQAQGYRMTLRQLYYQFVSQNLITNEEKSYKRLAGIISDARLAGLVDWNAIEDRGRVPMTPSHYDSAEDLVERLKGHAKYFNFDRWRDQPYYVELWVEKQALASVLEPLAHQHHVTLMVNKGYSSQSAMYDSAQRFREGMGCEGEPELFDPEFHSCTREEFKGTENRDVSYEREGVLLYLGDHDPSGEDMVRDIRERMTMFGVPDLDVKKVALTTAQVRQYRPPPNPAKVSDPRAEAYIALHGPRSWEVDALPPNTLVQLINTAIVDLIDQDALARVKKDEDAARKKVTKALATIKF